ncbi:concanavalin A-like lectin/glucanase [Hortaea werneckii]|nr:concanavalin A-like lectin/glucanase [Hortaea werneckii]KAI7001367.1 concanavalin A-like lectin/glucanase [Hortaea werneckii]KAI7142674.1 concanavalin A-like lectin/glucanase [Hortaea werneckii]KAI7170007.1 concanavalin A-like lectin/glucanase [Hortaea werneckii]
MRLSATAVAFAAALPYAFAQTSTDCDPLEKTCPNDTGLNSKSFSADFTSDGGLDSWTEAVATNIEIGDQGAEFSISDGKDAPTVETDFYIFFGRVDVTMKAAPGQGIVSSVVLESDDLDEIDWEWLGGDTTQVQTNFFGKGNTTTYDRGGFSSVSSPQDTFHTYTIDWNEERIEWIIDGSTVRTVTYDDPVALGGKNYPQTPMRVKLGSWCGGCAKAEATVEWAGGKTTFDNAPYIMYVKSVEITNNNPAKAYKYGDKSGSYESIKLLDTDNSNLSSSSSASSSGSTSAATSSGAAKTTETAAPSSSHSVEAVNQNTAGIVQSKTVSGSSPTSTGMMGGSGNSTTQGTAQGTGSMATSVVSATTQVPQQSGSSTSGSSGTGAASGSSGNSSASSDSPSSSSSTPAQPENGASANMIMTGGSLLSIALGFWML